MKNRGFTLIELMIVIAIIAIVVVAFGGLITGCTDKPAAARSLEGAGYSDIVLTGYRWRGCSDDDTFHTGFTAKGPTGKSVSGVVCSGWFKGATIRTD